MNGDLIKQNTRSVNSVINLAQYFIKCFTFDPGDKQDDRSAHSCECARETAALLLGSLLLLRFPFHERAAGSESANWPSPSAERPPATA